MFMSVVTRNPSSEVYPELAGARVIITGLTPAMGVDLARAFSERKARLNVQAPEASPELTEIAALVAGAAAEINLVTSPLEGPEAPVRFAQRAAAALGGIDVAVNLSSVTRAECLGIESEAEIEDLIASKLGPALRMTQVVANRMRLTWSEGTILNVVSMPAPETAREAAIAGYLRSCLAAITRAEAATWASDAIRINAVGPKATLFDGANGACLTSEPDLAMLALALASRRGRKLTGHVFDAEGIARRGC